MKRRHALKLGCAALLGSGGSAGRLFAAPSAGPRFLLVFLRGGYDSTNLLIPYSSGFYYEARPNIAIPRPDPASSTGALALDANWALAPAVRETIGAMYLERQAAFIPFAGTDDLSRSHFETQDSIELGQPTGAARNYRSGFLGRLSMALGGSAPQATSIAFTDALPLAFEGADTVPNLSLKNVGKPPFDARQAGILSGMYADHHLETAVREGLDLRQQVARKIAEEMTAASRSAVNTKGFELEAERMAHLMRDQYRLGFVDVGGWDTHVGEGAAQGPLAANLASLGRGLQVFAQTLGAEWNNTVVVVALGIRAHIPRERPPRHRPRARHGVLGARRRGQGRDRGRRAANRRACRPLAGSGFSGAERLPRGARGIVPVLVGSVGRPMRGGVSAKRNARPEARVGRIQRGGVTCKR
jgi:uncharacterized protein (DUF1501 family)